MTPEQIRENFEKIARALTEVMSHAADLAEAFVEAADAEPEFKVDDFVWLRLARHYAVIDKVGKHASGETFLRVSADGRHMIVYPSGVELVYRPGEKS